ncbi:MAG TPA: prolyl oligopeptidase family serine peptidase, partial [Pyrinomonadaceae bacterium]|nr:prolyl oligopeptidase family serine peptidase [Pyrinomonadaceae bacterium]
HDRRILFMQDVGGVENRHLCVLEENGKQLCLTKGERVKSGFYGWSRDAQYFYCTTDERAANHFDVYKVCTKDYDCSMIFQNDDGYLLASVSPDHHYLVLIKSEELSSSNLYLYSMRDHTLCQITRQQEKAQYLPLYFSPDCQRLYYQAALADDEDKLCINCVDIENGVTEEVECWSGKFRQAVVSHTGRYMAVLREVGECTTIDLHERSANRRVPLTLLPRGNVTSVAISRSDRLVAFYVNGDRQPNELYVYNLLYGCVKRLTNNLNLEIDPNDLVESETVGFNSFDGLQIPGHLWKPHQRLSAPKNPALIWVHGGPMGQSRKGYAGAVQYLVNHGYVVFAVNHRGSTGYGKAFMKAADRKQGREPLWDCIEGKRFLSTLGYVDSSRIGIIGGSFGGYMVLAALAFHPDEFALGIAICGVSNLVRHVSTKLGHRSLSKIYVEKIGDPDIDRELLEKASPIFHAQAIVKPLMLLHGAKDPRADKAESDDIAQAVRANGGVVEYVEFEDEAHGFRKRANSILAYERILMFLNKYLKDSNERCPDLIQEDRSSVMAC